MSKLVLMGKKHNFVVLNIASICTIRREAKKGMMVCSLADGSEIECSEAEFDIIVAASGGIYQLNELKPLSEKPLAYQYQNSIPE